MSATREEKIITRLSGISLGLCILAVGAVGGGAWRAASFWSEWNTWTGATDKRLERIEKMVESVTRDVWTGADMTRFAERLRAQNPDLQVPVPLVRPQPIGR